MIFNPYFLLFVLFIIYIVNNRKPKYDELLGESKEEFYNRNLLSENNFVNKYISVEDKSIITKTVEKDPKLYEIVSNYRYSLEYKFGYELSNIFKIKNVESQGLYENLLNNVINNKKKIVICSESNYLDLLEKKKINDNYNFVCSLFNTHFIMICRVEHNILNWKDILEYHILRKKKEFRDLLPNKLRIGIPNNKSNSYYDALKLFKCIGIDITKKNKDIDIIIDTEKNLFSKIKEKVDSIDSIDLIYLTSSYKNHYLEELLTTKSISVFGTDGIKDSLIKAEFKDGAFKSRIDNRKYTTLIKKRNIYDNPETITGDLKMFISDKENKIIGTKFHDSYITRVIVLAEKDLDKDYIKYLLRNIYGSIDKLRNKMNKYLLNEERINLIDKILDPHEMFYMNEKMKYHPGADEFYREVHFISDEENLKDNIYYRTNQKNLFSKLFIN